MELYDVMRTTGAVRRFTDDPLPDEVLERILDNARFAPSGGNRQGARVIVVRDRKTREAIVELSVTGARRYIAQTKNGEGPWNPVQPMKVSAEEVAATEVPPYLGAPLLQRRGRAGGLRGPQRLSRRSTSTSTASASSPAHPCTRSSGTSCWPRAMRATAAC